MRKTILSMALLLTVATASAQELSPERQASLDRIARLWPSAMTSGSPLDVAMQSELARVKAINPAISSDPEWLEAIVAKMASRLGIPATNMVVKAQPTPAATPVPGQRALASQQPQSAAEANAWWQSYQDRAQAERHHQDLMRALRYPSKPR